MTRTDFKKVADALRPFVGRTAVEPEEILLALARLFKDENEHFSPVVFLCACGMEQAAAEILASELVVSE